jgi:hypothetical protein
VTIIDLVIKQLNWCEKRISIERFPSGKAISDEMTRETSRVGKFYLEKIKQIERAISGFSRLITLVVAPRSLTDENFAYQSPLSAIDSCKHSAASMKGKNN